MATIAVYYNNGNYEEFSPTLLSFENGYILQNEFIKVDEIAEKGLIWERSYFTDEVEDPDNLGATIRQFQIIKPEDLNKIDQIILNSNIIVYPPSNHNEDENADFTIDNNEIDKDETIDIQEITETSLNEEALNTEIMDDFL